ncbi:Cytochrome c oxidase copper chaperone [Zea mays]|uniref:Cytochrome c oxidase copper chaperone n=1 Tax=Zea mays TaxID=4577 RepID=A0A1D6I4G0_MAIZE|nr:Cytochrome c oxidase copper chaperone [Zea mays]ONM55032.1 Cytochrome c oxidase copper chaperone [Zea mays]
MFGCNDLITLGLSGSCHCLLPLNSLGGLICCHYVTGSLRHCMCCSLVRQGFLTCRWTRGLYPGPGWQGKVGFD